MVKLGNEIVTDLALQVRHKNNKERNLEKKDINDRPIKGRKVGNKFGKER